MISVFLGG